MNEPPRLRLRRCAAPQGDAVRAEGQCREQPARGPAKRAIARGAAKRRSAADEDFSRREKSQRAEGERSTPPANASRRTRPTVDATNLVTDPMRPRLCGANEPPRLRLRRCAAPRGGAVRAEGQCREQPARGLAKRGSTANASRRTRPTVDATNLVTDP